MTRSSVDTSSRSLMGSKETPGIPSAEDILTVAEAAALLRVNRKTLYEVIRFNQPRWAIRFGRSIRVSRSALLEAFRGNHSPALGDE